MCSESFQQQKTKKHMKRKEFYEKRIWPAVARSLGVSSIPTFAVVRDGEVVHQFTGSRPKASFKAQLDRALA